MLILLPPSEGKARPQQGAPVDLDALAFPQLRPQRERLLDVLGRVASGNRKRALTALGLSEGQAGDLELDAALRESPAAPAAEVYTGVLYERLRLPELDAGGRVLIASALWGFVAPEDRIPAYRLSIGAKLPRLAGLAAWWRPHLSSALPDEPGLVVDMRSGGYAAAWRPRRATLLPVRAFTPEGKVVSHMAKRVRGDVARVLLESGSDPATPGEAAEVVAAAGLSVTLAGGTLDVVDAP